MSHVLTYTTAKANCSDFTLKYIQKHCKDFYVEKPFELERICFDYFTLHTDAIIKTEC